jgi:hypothetical protein
MDFQLDPARTQTSETNNRLLASSPPPPPRDRNTHFQQEEVMKSHCPSSLGLGTGGGYSKVVFLGNLKCSEFNKQDIAKIDYDTKSRFSLVYISYWHKIEINIITLI